MPGRGPAVRLLGSIEVTGPVGPAILSGPRQRALVGLLALNVGALTTRSRLIDALWGSQPPRTALKTLYSHVVRIRQSLDQCGLPGVLATRDQGYELVLAPDEVDAWAFEEHARAAQRALEDGAAARAAERLRAGLALWRGDAFADSEVGGWAAVEITRLHEVRLVALEDLWDAELRLGRHARAVGELERLAGSHPTRERFAELLMLACHRSGRQKQALDTYQRLRRSLADELGVDPGPALQRLHTGILRRDPALDPPAPADGPVRLGAADATTILDAPTWSPRPAQLPARTGHFTGRADELDQLDRVLPVPGEEPCIGVVTGPAGIGKTALAVQWAHRVRERFPDGQIFLDLRGHDPHTAMTAEEALSHLLRSLGVPESRIPLERGDQVSLYRSLLYDRRVLVLLDNGGATEQLLPLVPPTESSVLVVTSRSRAALAAYHAVRLVSLEVLAPGEARALLRAVLGADRTATEPAEVDRLIALCDRMPLALRIAAAKLTASPTSRIGDLTTELAAADRLGALAVEGDSRSVRTVFASAYHALSARAATMFRLLTVHPGRVFGVDAAAATAGVTVAEARRALGELAGAHLLADVAPGRYRFHDLIRLYAAECARVDETAARRQEAVHRVLDWYLAIVDAANRTLDGRRNRISATLAHPPPEIPFALERAAVLSYLDTERENVVPVVRYAAEHGHDRTAYALTYLLASYHEFRGHWGDRVEICRAGVAAAVRVGEAFVEGLMRTSLGVAYCEIRRFDDALEQLSRALELSRASGDPRGEGTAYNNMAVAYSGLRRFAEAIDAFTRALEVHRANGQTLGVALALGNIGDTYARMGEAGSSFGYLDRALEMMRSVGSPRFEAGVLNSMGLAHLAAGEYAQALARFDDALELRRRIGDRRFEAETLHYAGQAKLGLGDLAAAAALLREAVEVSRQAADQHLEAMAVSSLATVSRHRGDLGEARRHLRFALTLRTRVPDAHEEAGLRDALAELDRLTGSDRRQHASSLTMITSVRGGVTAAPPDTE
jgi:DNA-binding SARP family transcriptional activator/tetratricopeptide (TPR) repeat protein